jgi:hypothetical protein
VRAEFEKCQEVEFYLSIYMLIERIQACLKTLLAPHVELALRISFVTENAVLF